MWKIRLDKYLWNLQIASRKEISQLCKKWKILVNWEKSKSDQKIDFWNEIFLDFENPQVLKVKEFVYILINKPAGYVCSELDEHNYKSYKHLLNDCIRKNVLKVAWRLDADTQGLLLCTNDGKFIHQITSPKKTLTKSYYVETRENLTQENIFELENWVILEDWYKTLPAKVDILGEKKINLHIHEWKFHQIKRMLWSVWNEVLFLKRYKIWDFELWDLKLWSWKEIEV